MKLKHIGIDFGAKKAGTTAIAYEKNKQIKVIISNKNEDADLFIKSFLKSNKIEYIFIDAPLSLPKVFTSKDKSNSSNYFYRKCDVESKAMSPMFIGGLTARAIKLKDSFPSIKFIETYPKLLAHKIDNVYYKKNKLIFVKAIEKYFEIKIEEQKTWHEIDAILAYLSGCRYLKNEHHSYGDEDEGIIIF